MFWGAWWGFVGGATAALPLMGLVSVAHPPTGSASITSPEAAAHTVKPMQIASAAGETPAAVAIASALAAMPAPPVITSAVAEKPAAAPIAADKAAPPVKKTANTKKSAPTKKVTAAAKKPAAPKVAAAGPKTPAKKTAAAKKPEEAKVATATRRGPPSYTVTTTQGGLITVATRIVPLPGRPAPADTVVTSRTAPPAQAKAMPVSLTRTVETAPTAAKAKPLETAAILAPVERPTTAPAPAQTAAKAKPVETVAISAPAQKSAATAPVAAAPIAIAPIAAAPIQTPASTPAPPTMASTESAAGFVGNFLKSAFHIARLPGAGSLQRRAQLADLFAGKMDVPRIAGYTTGDELKGATPDIQNRFRTILVSYLVETYYPRLELASDPTVRVETVAGDRLADGTTVVWTTFTKDGWGSQSIKWHLHPAADGYKIVDIVSAGASLVQMERDTFLSVMRNGGLNQLMAKLDERTKQLASAATE